MSWRRMVERDLEESMPNQNVLNQRETRFKP